MEIGELITYTDAFIEDHMQENGYTLITPKD